MMDRTEEIISEIHLPLKGLTGKVIEKTFTSIWLGEIKKQDKMAVFKLSDADPRLKPYDVFGIYKGTHVSIELKRIIGTSCHPYRLLRGSSAKNPGSQVKGLQDTVRHGGVSLVIVYSDKIKEYAILDFKQLDFNTKYKFDV